MYNGTRQAGKEITNQGPDLYISCTDSIKGIIIAFPPVYWRVSKYEGSKAVTNTSRKQSKIRS